MLELRNVSKRFAGSLAVDNVSFRARPGEVTGYLGPNGSGKSTTIKMIVGLIDTTAGDITFNGHSIQRDAIAWKQRLGYVPEEPHLYAHLSGLEYLVMVGQLRDLPARPTGDRIDGLLRLLALHDDRHVPISAYSKGMRQKVLLAAALLHNPDLLLLDEPFSGLDVGSALVLRSLIQELAGARQGRALQLSRARNGRARLVARRDPASRQSRGRRFDRAPADADGAVDARGDLRAARRRNRTRPRCRVRSPTSSAPDRHDEAAVSRPLSRLPVLASSIASCCRPMPGAMRASCCSRSSRCWSF